MKSTTILTLPNVWNLHFNYHRSNNLPIATNNTDNSLLMSMAFNAFTSQDASDSLVAEHNQNKESLAIKFTGGTFFVDHCAKFIFIHSQVSLGTGETLVAKPRFVSLFHTFGFSILQIAAEFLVLNLSRYQ